MNKLLKKFAITLFFLISLILPQICNAYQMSTEYAPSNSPFVFKEEETMALGFGGEETAVNTVILVIKIITGAILGFAAAIAIYFIAMGGFNYVFSMGKPDAMEKAKKTIIWAVLGLLAVIFSYIIISSVIRLVLTVEEEIPPEPLPEINSTPEGGKLEEVKIIPPQQETTPPPS